MKRLHMIARAGLVAASAAVMLAVSAVSAFAVDPTTPAEVIDQLATDTKTNVFAISPKALVILGIMLAIGVGVRLITRSTKSV